MLAGASRASSARSASSSARRPVSRAARRRTARRCPSRPSSPRQRDDLLVTGRPTAWARYECVAAASSRSSSATANGVPSVPAHDRASQCAGHRPGAPRPSSGSGPSRSSTTEGSAVSRARRQARRGGARGPPPAGAAGRAPSPSRARLLSSAHCRSSATSRAPSPDRRFQQAQPAREQRARGRLSPSSGRPVAELGEQAGQAPRASAPVAASTTAASDGQRLAQQRSGQTPCLGPLGQERAAASTGSGEPRVSSASSRDFPAPAAPATTTTPRGGDHVPQLRQLAVAADERELGEGRGGAGTGTATPVSGRSSPRKQRQLQPFDLCRRVHPELVGQPPPQLGEPRQRLCRVAGRGQRPCQHGDGGLVERLGGHRLRCAGGGSPRVAEAERGLRRADVQPRPGPAAAGSRGSWAHSA